jgi:hypothetical protein
MNEMNIIYKSFVIYNGYLDIYLNRNYNFIFQEVFGKYLSMFLKNKFEDILRDFCFNRFSGEPVNLRDQHDAVEFLNTVVDSVDEALKSLNLPQICSKVLGGTFADQKICKDCPHR